eukprot:SAG31_NODE_41214_length_277_cov_0.584270_1_plen_47_part_10
MYSGDYRYFEVRTKFSATNKFSTAVAPDTYTAGQHSGSTDPRYICLR